jgi:hypothetical protein
MFNNLPIILADHSPWHTILEVATSPLGIFVLIGVVGVVALTVIRRK